MVGHRKVVVMLIGALKLTGGAHPWSLYFPLPFRYSLILDLVQNLAHLRVHVPLVRKLLVSPLLREACQGLVGALNGLFMQLPVKNTTRSHEDSAVLLSLYMWFFFAAFLPMFTAWYIEMVYKERFVADVVPGRLKEPIAFYALAYLLVFLLVAIQSWNVLYLLVAGQLLRQ